MVYYTFIIQRSGNKLGVLSLHFSFQGFAAKRKLYGFKSLGPEGTLCSFAISGVLTQTPSVCCSSVSTKLRRMTSTTSLYWVLLYEKNIYQSFQLETKLCEFELSKFCDMKCKISSSNKPKTRLVLVLEGVGLFT